MMGSYRYESPNAERKPISRKPIHRIATFRPGSDQYAKIGGTMPNFNRYPVKAAKKSPPSVTDPMRDKFRRISCSAPTAEKARLIAYGIKRHIIETKEQVKRSPNFVKRTHTKIIYLHNYNCRVAAISSMYPLDEDVKKLLVKYIELEMSIFKNPEYNTDIYRLIVEMRLLSLLSCIYSKYCFYTKGKFNSNDTWQLILALFEEMPYDVPKFFEDIRQKVRKKIDFGPVPEHLNTITLISQLTCYKELDGSVKVEIDQENDPLLRCCEAFNIVPKLEATSLAISNEPFHSRGEVIISNEEITDTGQLSINDIKEEYNAMFLPNLAQRLKSLKRSAALTEDKKPEIIDLCGDTNAIIVKTNLKRRTLIVVDSSDDEDAPEKNFRVQKSSAVTRQCDKNLDNVKNISDDKCKNNENVISSLGRNVLEHCSDIDGSDNEEEGGTYRTQDESEILRQIRQLKLLSGSSEVTIKMVNNNLVISPKDNLNVTNVNIITENQALSVDTRIPQSSPTRADLELVNKDKNSAFVDFCTESLSSKHNSIKGATEKDNLFGDDVLSAKANITHISKTSIEETSSDINPTLTFKHNDTTDQSTKTVILYKSAVYTDLTWASSDTFKSLYETEFEHGLQQPSSFTTVQHSTKSGDASVINFQDINEQDSVSLKKISEKLTEKENVSLETFQDVVTNIEALKDCPVEPAKDTRVHNVEEVNTAFQEEKCNICQNLCDEIKMDFVKSSEEENCQHRNDTVMPKKLQQLRTSFTDTTLNNVEEESALPNDADGDLDENILLGDDGEENDTNIDEDRLLKEESDKSPEPEDVSVVSYDSCNENRLETHSEMAREEIIPINRDIEVITNNAHTQGTEVSTVVCTDCKNNDDGTKIEASFNDIVKNVSCDIQIDENSQMKTIYRSTDKQQCEISTELTTKDTEIEPEYPETQKEIEEYLLQRTDESSGSSRNVDATLFEKRTDISEITDKPQEEQELPAIHSKKDEKGKETVEKVVEKNLDARVFQEIEESSQNNQLLRQHSDDESADVQKIEELAENKRILVQSKDEQTGAVPKKVDTISLNTDSQEVEAVPQNDKSMDESVMTCSEHVKNTKTDINEITRLSEVDVQVEKRMDPALAQNMAELPENDQLLQGDTEISSKILGTEETIENESELPDFANKNTVIPSSKIPTKESIGDEADNNFISDPKELKELHHIKLYEGTETCPEKISNKNTVEMSFEFAEPHNVEELPQNTPLLSENTEVYPENVQSKTTVDTSIDVAGLQKVKELPQNVHLLDKDSKIHSTNTQAENTVAKELNTSDPQKDNQLVKTDLINKSIESRSEGAHPEITETDPTDLQNDQELNKNKNTDGQSETKEEKHVEKCLEIVSVPTDLQEGETLPQNSQSPNESGQIQSQYEHKVMTIEAEVETTHGTTDPQNIRPLVADSTDNCSKNLQVGEITKHGEITKKFREFSDDRNSTEYISQINTIICKTEPYEPTEGIEEASKSAENETLVKSDNITTYLTEHLEGINIGDVIEEHIEEEMCEECPVYLDEYLVQNTVEISTCEYYEDGTEIDNEITNCDKQDLSENVNSLADNSVDITLIEKSELPLKNEDIVREDQHEIVDTEEENMCLGKQETQITCNKDDMSVNNNPLADDNTVIKLAETLQVDESESNLQGSKNIELQCDNTVRTKKYQNDTVNTGIENRNFVKNDIQVTETDSSVINNQDMSKSYNSLIQESITLTEKQEIQKSENNIQDSKNMELECDRMPKKCQHDPINTETENRNLIKSDTQLTETDDSVSDKQDMSKNYNYLTQESTDITLAEEQKFEEAESNLLDSKNIELQSNSKDMVIQYQHDAVNTEIENGDLVTNDTQVTETDDSISDKQGMSKDYNSLTQESTDITPAEEQKFEKAESNLLDSKNIELQSNNKDIVIKYQHDAVNTEIENGDLVTNDTQVTETDDSISDKQGMSKDYNSLTQESTDITSAEEQKFEESESNLLDSKNIELQSNNKYMVIKYQHDTVNTEIENRNLVKNDTQVIATDVSVSDNQYMSKDYNSLAQESTDITLAEEQKFEESEKNSKTTELQSNNNDMVIKCQHDIVNTEIDNRNLVKSDTQVIETDVSVSDNQYMSKDYNSLTQESTDIILAEEQKFEESESNLLDSKNLELQSNNKDMVVIYQHDTLDTEIENKDLVKNDTPVIETDDSISDKQGTSKDYNSLTQESTDITLAEEQKFEESENNSKTTELLSNNNDMVIKYQHDIVNTEIDNRNLVKNDTQVIETDDSVSDKQDMSKKYNSLIQESTDITLAEEQKFEESESNLLDSKNLGLQSNNIDMAVIHHHDAVNTEIENKDLVKNDTPIIETDDSISDKQGTSKDYNSLTQESTDITLAEEQKFEESEKDSKNTELQSNNDMVTKYQHDIVNTEIDNRNLVINDTQVIETYDSVSDKQDMSKNYNSLTQESTDITLAEEQKFEESENNSKNTELQSNINDMVIKYQHDIVNTEIDNRNLVKSDTQEIETDDSVSDKQDMSKNYNSLTQESTDITLAEEQKFEESEKNSKNTELQSNNDMVIKYQHDIVNTEIDNTNLGKNDTQVIETDDSVSDKQDMPKNYNSLIQESTAITLAEEQNFEESQSNLLEIRDLVVVIKDQYGTVDTEIENTNLVENQTQVTDTVVSSSGKQESEHYNDLTGINTDITVVYNLNSEFLEKQNETLDANVQGCKNDKEAIKENQEKIDNSTLIAQENVNNTGKDNQNSIYIQDTDKDPEEVKNPDDISEEIGNISQTSSSEKQTNDVLHKAAEEIPFTKHVEVPENLDSEKGRKMENVLPCEDTGPPLCIDTGCSEVNAYNEDYSEADNTQKENEKFSNEKSETSDRSPSVESILNFTDKLVIEKIIENIICTIENSEHIANQQDDKSVATVSEESSDETHRKGMMEIKSALTEDLELSRHQVSKIEDASCIKETQEIHDDESAVPSGGSEIVNVNTVANTVSNDSIENKYIDSNGSKNENSGQGLSSYSVSVNQTPLKKPLHQYNVYMETMHTDAIEIASAESLHGRDILEVSRNLKEDEVVLYVPEPVEYTQEQLRILQSMETKARDSPVDFLNAVKNITSNEEDGSVLNLTSAKRTCIEKEDMKTKNVKINKVSQPLNLPTNNNIGEKKMVNHHYNLLIPIAKEPGKVENNLHKNYRTGDQEKHQAVNQSQLKPSDIPSAESFASYLPKNGESPSLILYNTHEDPLEDLRQSLSKFGTDVIPKSNEDLHLLAETAIICESINTDNVDRGSDSEGRLLIDEDSCTPQEYPEVQSEVILGPSESLLIPNDFVLQIQNSFQSLLGQGSSKKRKSIKSLKNSITLYKEDSVILSPNRNIVTEFNDIKRIQNYPDLKTSPTRRKPNILKRKTKNNSHLVEKKCYLQPKLIVLSDEPQVQRMKTKAEKKQLPPCDPFKSLRSDSDDDIPLAERVKSRTPSPKKAKSRYGTTDIVIGRSGKNEIGAVDEKMAAKRTRGKSGDRLKDIHETTVRPNIPLVEEVIVKQIKSRNFQREQEVTIEEPVGKRTRRKSGEIYKDVEKPNMSKNQVKSIENYVDSMEMTAAHSKSSNEAHEEFEDKVIDGDTGNAYRSKLRPRSCSGSDFAIDNPSVPAVDVVPHIIEPVGMCIEVESTDLNSKKLPQRFKSSDIVRRGSGATSEEVSDMLIIVDNDAMSEKIASKSGDAIHNEDILPYVSKLRRKPGQEYNELLNLVDVESISIDNNFKIGKKIRSGSSRSKKTSKLPKDTIEQEVSLAVKPLVGRGRGRKSMKILNPNDQVQKVLSKAGKTKKIKKDEQNLPPVDAVSITQGVNSILESVKDSAIKKTAEKLTTPRKPVKKPNLKFDLNQTINEYIAKTIPAVNTPSEIKENVQNAPLTSSVPSATTPKERYKREFKAQIENAKTDTTKELGILKPDAKELNVTNENHLRSQENLELEAPKVMSEVKVVHPKLRRKSLFSNCKNTVEPTTEKLIKLLQIDPAKLMDESDKSVAEEQIKREKELKSGDTVNKIEVTVENIVENMVLGALPCSLDSTENDNTLQEAELLIENQQSKFDVVKHSDEKLLNKTTKIFDEPKKECDSSILSNLTVQNVPVETVSNLENIQDPMVENKSNLITGYLFDNVNTHDNRREAGTALYDEEKGMGVCKEILRTESKLYDNDTLKESVVSCMPLSEPEKLVVPEFLDSSNNVEKPVDNDAQSLTDKPLENSDNDVDTALEDSMLDDLPLSKLKNIVDSKNADNNLDIKHAFIDTDTHTIHYTDSENKKCSEPMIRENLKLENSSIFQDIPIIDEVVVESCENIETAPLKQEFECKEKETTIKDMSTNDDHSTVILDEQNIETAKHKSSSGQERQKETSRTDDLAEDDPAQTDQPSVEKGMEMCSPEQKLEKNQKVTTKTIQSNDGQAATLLDQQNVETAGEINSIEHNLEQKRNEEPVNVAPVNDGKSVTKQIVQTTNKVTLLEQNLEERQKETVEDGMGTKDYQPVIFSDQQNVETRISSSEQDLIHSRKEKGTEVSINNDQFAIFFSQQDVETVGQQLKDKPNGTDVNAVPMSNVDSIALADEQKIETVIQTSSSERKLEGRHNDTPATVAPIINASLLVEEHSLNKTNDSNDSDLVSIAQEAAKHACEDFEEQGTYFDDSGTVVKHDLHMSIGGEVEIIDISKDDKEKEKMEIQDKLLNLLHGNRKNDVCASSEEQEKEINDLKPADFHCFVESIDLNKNESIEANTSKYSDENVYIKKDGVTTPKEISPHSKLSSSSKSARRSKDNLNVTIGDSDSEIEIKKKYLDKSKKRVREGKQEEHRKAKTISEPEKEKSSNEKYQTKDLINKKYRNEQRTSRQNRPQERDSGHNDKRDRSGSVSSINSTSSLPNLSIGKDKDKHNDNNRSRYSRSDTLDKYRDHEKDRSGSRKIKRYYKDNDNREKRRERSKDKYYKDIKKEKNQYDKYRDDKNYSKEKSERQKDNRVKLGHIYCSKNDKKSDKPKEEYRKKPNDKRIIGNKKNEKKEDKDHNTEQKSKSYKKANKISEKGDRNGQENLKSKVMDKTDSGQNKRETRQDKKIHTVKKLTCKEGLFIMLDRKSIFQDFIESTPDKVEEYSSVQAVKEFKNQEMSFANKKQDLRTHKELKIKLVDEKCRELPSKQKNKFSRSSEIRYKEFSKNPDNKNVKEKTFVSPNIKSKVAVEITKVSKTPNLKNHVSPEITKVSETQNIKDKVVPELVKILETPNITHKIASEFTKISETPNLKNKVAPEITKISETHNIKDKVVLELAKIFETPNITHKIASEFTKISETPNLKNKVDPEITKISESENIKDKVVPELAKISETPNIKTKVAPEFTKISETPNLKNRVAPEFTESSETPDLKVAPEITKISETKNNKDKFVPEFAKISETPSITHKVASEFTKISDTPNIKNKVTPIITAISETQNIKDKVVPELAKIAETPNIKSRNAPEITMIAKSQNIKDKIVPDLVKSSESPNIKNKVAPKFANISETPNIKNEVVAKITNISETPSIKNKEASETTTISKTPITKNNVAVEITTLFKTPNIENEVAPEITKISKKGISNQKPTEHTVYAKSMETNFLNTSNSSTELLSNNDSSQPFEKTKNAFKFGKKIDQRNFKNLLDTPKAKSIEKLQNTTSNLNQTTDGAINTISRKRKSTEYDINDIDHIIETTPVQPKKKKIERPKSQISLRNEFMRSTDGVKVKPVIKESTVRSVKEKPITEPCYSVKKSVENIQNPELDHENNKKSSNSDIAQNKIEFSENMVQNSQENQQNNKNSIPGTTGQFLAVQTFVSGSCLSKELFVANQNPSENSKKENKNHQTEKIRSTLPMDSIEEEAYLADDLQQLVPTVKEVNLESTLVCEDTSKTKNTLEDSARISDNMNKIKPESNASFVVDSISQQIVIANSPSEVPTDSQARTSEELKISSKSKKQKKTVDTKSGPSQRIEKQLPSMEDDKNSLNLVTVKSHKPDLTASDKITNRAEYQTTKFQESFVPDQENKFKQDSQLANHSLSEEIARSQVVSDLMESDNCNKNTSFASESQEDHVTYERTEIENSLVHFPSNAERQNKIIKDDTRLGKQINDESEVPELKDNVSFFELSLVTEVTEGSARQQNYHQSMSLNGEENGLETVNHLNQTLNKLPESATGNHQKEGQKTSHQIINETFAQYLKSPGKMTEAQSLSKTKQDSFEKIELTSDAQSTETVSIDGVGSGSEVQISAQSKQNDSKSIDFKSAFDGNQDLYKQMPDCFRNPSPPVPGNIDYVNSLDFRNPSPPVTTCINSLPDLNRCSTSVDLDPFSVGSDTQRPQIYPDFVENKDVSTLLKESGTASQVTGATSSLPFVQSHIPTTIQNSMFQQNFETGYQNDIVSTIDAQYNQVKHAYQNSNLSKIVVSSSQPFYNQQHMVSSNEHMTVSSVATSLTTDSTQSVQALPAYMQRLKENVFCEVKTERESKFIDRKEHSNVLPSNVKFLEEYPCTFPENVLPNYNRNETFQASPAPSSVSQHSETTRDTAEVNSVTIATSSFQKGDHTYPKDVLMNWQLEDKNELNENPTGEYVKTITEYDMDELEFDLSLIDESSTPASGIFGHSNSISTDGVWPFGVEPDNPNKPLTSWDESSKVVVEPQPQDYSTYYPDFSCLNNALAGDITELSQGSESSDLEKANIDFTDWFNLSSAPEEIPAKKMRLQETVTQQPTKEDEGTVNGIKKVKAPKAEEKKKPELLVVPTRKRGWTRVSAPPNRSQVPKIDTGSPIENKPASNSRVPEPKNPEELIVKDSKADSEQLPHLVPLSRVSRVTTRSASKRDVRENYVTPQSQSMYNLKIKTTKENKTTESSDINITIPSKPLVITSGVPGGIFSVDALLLKPGVSQSKANPQSASKLPQTYNVSSNDLRYTSSPKNISQQSRVATRSTAVSSQTDPSKQKQVTLSKQDLIGKTVRLQIVNPTLLKYISTGVKNKPVEDQTSAPPLVALQPENHSKPPSNKPVEPFENSLDSGKNVVSTNAKRSLVSDINNKSPLPKPPLNKPVEVNGNSLNTGKNIGNLHAKKNLIADSNKKLPLPKPPVEAKPINRKSPNADSESLVFETRTMTRKYKELINQSLKRPSVPDTVADAKKPCVPSTTSSDLFDNLVKSSVNPIFKSNDSKLNTKDSQKRDSRTHHSRSSHAGKRESSHFERSKSAGSSREPSTSPGLNGRERDKGSSKYTPPDLRSKSDKSNDTLQKTPSPCDSLFPDLPHKAGSTSPNENNIDGSQEQHEWRERMTPKIDPEWMRLPTQSRLHTSGSNSK